MKRGYSRAFTPTGERRCRIELDKIPPTLYESARAKCKREGISMRALILGWLREWVNK